VSAAFSKRKKVLTQRIERMGREAALDWKVEKKRSLGSVSLSLRRRNGTERR